MGFLDKVTGTKRRAPRRVMVYGIHGIGKSTFAANAPGAVFIPCEDGLANIDSKAFPLAKSYADVVACLNELLTGKHEFKTVVIDTLDSLERLVFAQVCREHSKASIETFDFGKGYVFALGKWDELIGLMDRLRTDRNMTCILIGHAEVKRYNHPDVPDFDRFQPKMHNKASAMLAEWCDDVLFVTRPVTTISGGGTKDKPRKIGKLMENAVVRTRDTAAAMAKVRITAPIPDEIPLSWPIYADWAWNDGKNQLVATEPAEQQEA